MSFQGFQGNVDTSGKGFIQGETTETRLKRAREEAIKAAALNNRTTTGLILDTNKAAGGATNIPSSQSVIIGGKAVNKANIGRNITSSRPSILSGGKRLYADSPNLTNAQKSALGIFAVQNAATNSTANSFSSERRAQQLNGKSIAEANAIASGIQTNPLNAKFQGKQIGLSTKDRNIINTTAQTDIIRSNAAKLSFAERLISQQTDTNRSLSPNTTQELDNLQGLLDKAPNQDQPIQQINVQGDEFGNLVSPRNVKLQIENAGLTGGLTQPVLNIIGSQGTTPNINEVQQAIQSSLDDITDGAQIGSLTSVFQLPDGTLGVNFSENAPDIFRQQFGDAVFESLGQYFDLKDQGVEDFFDNPEGLRIKIGEEEVQLGGSNSGGGGFASDLLNNQGFDIIGILTNPIVLIAVAGIAGLVLFTKYGRGSLNGTVGKIPLVSA